MLTVPTATPSASPSHETLRAVTTRSATADIVHNFNPYLHGSRGVFALMVVVFHVANSRLPTFAILSRSWPLFALRSFEHGVELFFGISGIVIVGALSRARGPLVFAIERGTRIYPVLWASVLTIVALSMLTGFEGRSAPSLPVLAANLLGLPPALPGPLIHPAAWSLSYELLFYGFCALGWMLRRRLGTWAAWLIVPVALLLVIFHIRTLLMPVGMGIAVLLVRRPQWSRYAPAPGVCLLIFLLVWECVCEACGGDLINAPLGSLVRGFVPLGIVAATIAGALTYAGVLGGRGAFSRVLAWRPMQFLGGVSYSLYLWHPIVMSMIKHLMYVAHVPAHAGPYSQLIFLIVSLPCSLTVAWMSQITLEKRVTRWLRIQLEQRTGVRRPIRAPETVTQSVLDAR